LLAVFAVAVLEWPEKPRAATATNASSSAVAAPVSPRLALRRRANAASRRRSLRTFSLRMPRTVPDRAKRAVS